MRRYRWKLVLVRDFFALLVALFWALRSYTDAWNRTKRCDPTWQGFLSYIVLTVAALTAAEMFSGAGQRIRRVFRQGDQHIQIEEGQLRWFSSPRIASTMIFPIPPPSFPYFCFLSLWMGP